MEKKVITNDSKDLIIALTDDYLNVYHVRPEEDKFDIIKLDGFVTEGIEGSWENLSYSALLATYIKSRVHPDEQQRFLHDCSRENIIECMKEEKILQARYRVVDNGQIHYYAYKYVKVSSNPLSVVAAFRNVDTMENNDRKRVAELEKLKSIIASSELGTWQLIADSENDFSLHADAKMRQLMGIPKDSGMTPKDIFNMLIERIHPSDVELFMKYDRQLREGLRAECTYRWIHPFLGERYMRCGGVMVPTDHYFCCNGYHYDVTNQINKEMRSSQIIKSFARSYDFINYIHLPEATFYSYSDNTFDDENVLDVLMAGNAYRAIEVGCEKIVLDEDKDKMLIFSNLDTMNERLKYSNVIIGQFKNKRHEWYESSFSVAERNADGTIKGLVWAVRKIDDEKQVEIRRQKQLEDNIAANKAKTNFLHNMSHEIRTPLNALFGFAQLLGLPDGTWTDEEKELYNNHIYSSYNMLDMLISDIIDIADSEHGNYRIELSDTVVNSVCSNAIMSVDYRKPDGVNMYYTSEVPDDYTIMSDGRRIQQVLINFLTNACKNTQQGEIHLHCSNTENPGKLTFSVTDTGIGVPKEKADLIFNRFIKLDQNMQGAGLGLNICLTIASKLDGEVYLDKTYTNGARFVFTIEDKK